MRAKKHKRNHSNVCIYSLFFTRKRDRLETEITVSEIYSMHPVLINYQMSFQQLAACSTPSRTLASLPCPERGGLGARRGSPGRPEGARLTDRHEIWHRDAR